MTAPSDAPSGAMPEAHRDTPAAAPVATSVTRPFYWSVRRELWEHRALYVAPVAVAGLVLFGFLVSLIDLPRRAQHLSELDPARQAAALAEPYHFAAAAIMFTALIVGLFYCLGALHNERRDRSILFWKSLPVSDLVTVLSKASIPLVVMPLITFIVVVALQVAMLLLNTVGRVASGISAAPLWTQVPLVQMELLLAYGMIVVALWYAPVYGWLLLVSGWARRAPFLWAVLPPLALCLVEKIAFDTHYFGSILVHRLGGFSDAFGDGAFSRRAGAGGMSDPLSHVDAVVFLSMPGLWAGLAVAAGFIAAAVWQRRYRDPN